MFKKLMVFVLLLSLVLVAVPVSAANYDTHSAKCSSYERVQPIIYERTITVTENGGVFAVGFADVVFKKNFLGSRELPMVFRVEISAVNGVPGIEFHPDVQDFRKDVVIQVDAYKGLLYDKALKKNIYVNIKKQQLTVSHFSRYAFS